MAIYTFPFSAQESWTLSDANISDGTLNITAEMGYGQRIPDGNWLSGAEDDFEIDFDFHMSSGFQSSELCLKLYDDADDIRFYLRADYDYVRIYHEGVKKASTTFEINANTWYTGKVRRVGTTYYFKVNDGDEISWDYGIQRAVEWLRLISTIGATAKFDNFIYRWTIPMTHEIAGVINGLSQIVGESTVIGTYIFPFTTDDGKWTLSDAQISGGVLDITALGGYGQRSPDANWYSDSTDDFIYEADFKQDSTPAGWSILTQIKLVDDANTIFCGIHGGNNEMEIRHGGVPKDTQSFTDDTNWHTLKIRRVGTVYYFSIDGGTELSWDYGTEREIEWIDLHTLDCTAEFDDFQYSWIEIGGIHFIKAVVNGISTIAGDLKGTFFITGNIDAVSQVIGKIAGDISISGQIQALSEVNGQIIVGKYLSGNIDAVSQVEGNLTGIFYLVGEVQGQSAITGLPHIIRFLKGTIAGQSVIIGILEDADKWTKPDRDTSQFSKISRGASAFSKTSRDASTWTKEERK